MQKRSSMTLLAAAMASVALLGAGCSDQSSPETVGQKMERTADKMAATTENATAKTATAIDDSALTTKVKTCDDGRSIAEGDADQCRYQGRTS